MHFIYIPSLHSYRVCTTYNRLIWLQIGPRLISFYNISKKIKTNAIEFYNYLYKKNEIIFVISSQYAWRAATWIIFNFLSVKTFQSRIKICWSTNTLVYFRFFFGLLTSSADWSDDSLNFFKSAQNKTWNGETNNFQWLLHSSCSIRQ